MLGGVIGNNNFKYTFFSQFILCVTLGVLVFFLLEEPSREKNSTSKEKNNKKINYSNLLNKNLIIMFIIVIAFYFASTSYNSTINYYIEDVLNLPPTFIGGFLAFVGIIGFVIYRKKLLNIWIEIGKQIKWNGSIEYEIEKENKDGYNRNDKNEFNNSI